MNCEAVQTELKAYQDGELDRLDAWRVRRHVGRCAPCAEELRTMKKLNALLLSADIVPSEPRASASGTSSQPRASASGPAWKSRRVQWVSAGAAVLAAALLALNTTGRTDALAAAVNALTQMTQMKSWKTCHLIRRSPGGWTYEQWVRIPDDVHEEDRHNGALTSVSVQNARESWHYRADKNVAVHSRAKLLEPLNDRGVGALVGPLQDLQRLQQEARRVGGLVIHERQDRLPDGRPVRVIDLLIDPAKFYARAPGAPPLPKFEHEIIYLDARTEQLLRWDEVTEGETVTILGYDQAMPDALFTWQPPAGVNVVEFKGWWEARKNQKLATATSPEWNVTVHAVDVAANGDVWLTASERPRADRAGGNAQTLSPHWSPEGMTLKDERGRVYVEFACQMRERWSYGTALIGFTPLEPRRPSDPFPSRFTATLWPDYGSSQGTVHHRQTVTINGLDAPAPAGWILPPINPADAIAGSSGIDPHYEDWRQRARKGYREGTAW